MADAPLSFKYIFVFLCPPKCKLAVQMVYFLYTLTCYRKYCVDEFQGTCVPKNFIPLSHAWEKGAELKLDPRCKGIWPESGFSTI